MILFDVDIFNILIEDDLLTSFTDLYVGSFVEYDDTNSRSFICQFETRNNRLGKVEDCRVIITHAPRMINDQNDISWTFSPC